MQIKLTQEEIETAVKEYLTRHYTHCAVDELNFTKITSNSILYATAEVHTTTKTTCRSGSGSAI